MAFSLGGLSRGDTSWRSIAAAVAVLTLATTGNAILPLPYAFAVSGAVASTLIILFVALSNVFTCKLLLRGAVSTGASDYEQLAHAIGGPWLQLWSEAWIVVLLVGTNIGAIIQMGEAFGYAIQTQWPDSPNWLWDRSGTFAMLFFTLCVIFPLSMLPRMRQLEMVGNCGVVILFALAVIVMVKSISEGLPALSSGDFPHVSSGDLTSISETFSLLCFAFYHQVMMMPLLSEMPRVSSEAARRSAKELHRASTITILGTSGLYYWFTGFFGAAMYGATNISDNFLENTWISGVGTLIINLTVTIYLSISIPPIFHATNHTVDSWLHALMPSLYGGITRPWVQRFITNCCTILTCLGVALGVPGESGTVLSVTGATGVAMCSYILPVLFHFVLYFGKARCMRKHGSPDSDGSVNGIKKLAAAEVLGTDAAGSGPIPELGVDALAEKSGEEGMPATAVTAAPGSTLSRAPSRKGPVHAFVPHPTAPGGLLYPYYKRRRHILFTAAYDFVLPVLVLALGCFFSVTTLVLLFQPVEE